MTSPASRSTRTSRRQPHITLTEKFPLPASQPTERSLPKAVVLREFRLCVHVVYRPSPYAHLGQVYHLPVREHCHPCGCQTATVGYCFREPDPKKWERPQGRKQRQREEKLSPGHLARRSLVDHPFGKLQFLLTTLLTKNFDFLSRPERHGKILH